MKPVRDIVSRDVIEDLWGAGYTILPRRRSSDPFYFDPKMVPATRSYQWMHLVNDRVMIDGGWTPVPASRHDGYFMPAGHIGDIEVSGLGLFEKPKFEVDADHAKAHAKAHQNVADWVEKTGGQFSGHATVGLASMTIGDPLFDVIERNDTKTIETTVQIPKDMIPHMAAIFEERDKLKAEVVGPDRALIPGRIADRFYAEIEANPAAPWWPTLHAILLPLAIDRVRLQLNEGEKS